MGSRRPLAPGALVTHRRGALLRGALLLVALVAMACGKPLSRAGLPRSLQSDGRTIFGTLPMGPTDRPVLRGLPSVATYRWGFPGAHFSGTTPEEDSASITFAAHELRLAASEVLRVNGWREAPPGETAEFELAVIRYERIAEWFENQPDPRAQLPDPQTCRNRPAAQRANCVEPMPRDYPPIKVLRRGVDARVAVAIMRVSDRATAWWISPLMSDIQIATLRLLQAGWSGGTALEP